MNKYFCTAPWVHIHNWPDGKVFPCRSSLREYESLGNLYESSLEDIWNSELMQQFRKDLQANKPRPDFCGRCYESEAIGNKSLRQYCNESFMEQYKEQSKHEIVPPRLYYWDFRFDNTCNQGCRGCGPTLSSAWVDDAYQMTGVKFNGNAIKFVKFNKDNLNKTLIQEQVPYVTEINFAGGESTITQDHYYILSQLIENNRTDVKLTYTTNLSTTSYKDMDFLEVWPKFKEVVIHISLDDVEKRGEYWRHGLEWDKFLDNVKRVKELSEKYPNIKMAYSITVFTFNIHRMDSIVEYMQSNDLLNNNVKLIVNSSVCFAEHHDVSTLTEEFKQYAQQHVERAVELLNEHPNKSDMEAVVNKLKLLKCDYHKASKRHESVAHESLRIFAAKQYAQLDIIRKQSLKEVAPELYEFYKDYGYDEEYQTFVPFTL
jgi:radical SAM protein with 4Fe4S-binding SPASM domain